MLRLDFLTTTQLFSNFALVAQLDRVQASEAWGRWFESSRARHLYSLMTSGSVFLQASQAKPSSR